ncbi:hypothetical protein V1512DRAFT_128004 [Lipomyces arxii]|uniref:uncharacterized protein n=1 Tax=Lipomyces arxii TaxID=56418 RepID=UPI0034CE3F3B
MRPPWLPQNIQKRLLRYIISRVALFNDLDLANLDIQLGSNSLITLRDVRINVEALSVPGMFFRDGQVKEITVQVSRNILASPVVVTLTGVDLSVALSASASTTKDFLSHTTANLATSFLGSETKEETIELEQSILQSGIEDDLNNSTAGSDSDGFENGSPLLGFGVGGFNLQAVMAKVVDSLLSQLQITVHGLSLRVLLPDLVIQGSIEQCKIFTDKESVRQMKLNNLYFSAPPYSGFEASDLYSPYQSELSTESLTDDDDALSSDIETEGFDFLKKKGRSNQQKSSLVQSMLFSKEEAGSLYLSAVSPSTKTIDSRAGHIFEDLIEGSSGDRQTETVSNVEKHRGLLFCDELTISMAASMAKSELIFGTVRAGFGQMDSIFYAVMHFVDGFLNKDAFGDVDSFAVDFDAVDITSERPPNNYTDDFSARSRANASKTINVGFYKVEFSLSSTLREDGHFSVPDKISVCLSQLYASVSQSFPDDSNRYKPSASSLTAYAVSIDSVYAQKSSTTIMEFIADKDTTSIPDVGFEGTTEGLSLTMPKKLVITADTDVLVELVEASKLLAKVYAQFSSMCHSRSVKSVSGLRSAKKSDGFSRSFMGTTGFIHIRVLTADTVDLLNLTVHPLTITESSLQTDGFIAWLPGVSVSVHDLTYNLTPNITFTKFGTDSPFKKGDVSSYLLCDSLEINCSSLIDLNGTLSANRGNFNEVFAALHHAIPSPIPEMDFDTPHTHSLLLVSIKDADIALEFQSDTEKVTLHLSTVEVALQTLDLISIDIGYVRGARHPSLDSLGNLDDFELIGAALESRRRNRSMISVIIKDSRIVSSTVYNLRFEYRVDLLLLFVSLFEKEPITESKQGQPTKLDFLGMRSPSPTLGFDAFENDDPLHSEIDDEDYAEEDYGMEGDNQLNGSSATLQSENILYRMSVTVTDCAVGLNPLSLSSKGLFVITDGSIEIGCSRSFPAAMYSNIKVRRASLLLIDNVQNLSRQEPAHVGGSRRVQVVEHMTPYTDLGYVNVASVSSASANVKINPERDEAGLPHINVELKDDLLFIESCADSTQTLLEVFNGLKPPIVASDEVKYHTEILPVDILTGLDESAFKYPVTNKNRSSTSKEATAGRISSVSTDVGPAEVFKGSTESNLSDTFPEGLAIVDDYYGFQLSNSHEVKSNSSSFPETSVLSDSLLELEDQNLLDLPLAKESEMLVSSDGYADDSFMDDARQQVDNVVQKIQILENHFGAKSLIQASGSRIKAKYMSINVRDVHVLWNLHDGYDWPHTRETISSAVSKVQNKALEALRTRMQGGHDDKDNESIIGDILFNSIYIGIPSGNDPRDLTNVINNAIDDESETASQASGISDYSSRSSSRSAGRASVARKRSHLKLKRSKTHKVQVELKSVSIDYATYPDDSEVATSINLKIRDFEVFDNIPTSTWRKFATYMYSAGEREAGGSMAQVELLNVRPSPDLPTSEISMKIKILPLRLYVDQDALDFLTRFFEFKSDTLFPPVSEEIPFIQRCEFNEIKVKLDYKPKKVDYAGLRSGHTTEFMNFFVLDEAKIVLRGVVLYGVLGFSRLSKMLNDVWLPDIQSTQLGDVLAGVAPVKSLVRLGGGVKDLVVVPIREYRKDGRVVRGLQKGALRFAQVTTSELINLGSKLAVGTQSVLENAESLLVGQSSGSNATGGVTSDNSEEEEDNHKTVSLYADQPRTVVHGLQRAYSSLNRNFGTAKDILVALPGEASDQGGAQRAAVAIARAAPVAVLRSMIGATEAVSNTLMGVNNQMDPQHKRNMEDKYKRR